MRSNVYKVLIVLIIIVIAISASALLENQKNKERPDFVRIHIRANSNSDFDQNLKHKVKDEVITYLTPLLAQAETKDQALLMICNNLDNIQKITDNVLEKNKVEYLSGTSIVKEEFPSRSYGDFVLEKGVYDAVIINLGEGKGDNWWCVAFPPLCFVPENGPNVRYKSKILEIINKAKK